MHTTESIHPDHRHSCVPYIDLRRHLPALNASLSPDRAGSADTPVRSAEPPDRIAARADAEEFSRASVRLMIGFIVTGFLILTTVAWLAKLSE